MGSIRGTSWKNWLRAGKGPCLGPELDPWSPNKDGGKKLTPQSCPPIPTHVMWL